MSSMFCLDRYVKEIGEFVGLVSQIFAEKKNRRLDTFARGPLGK